MSPARTPAAKRTLTSKAQKKFKDLFKIVFYSSTIFKCSLSKNGFFGEKNGTELLKCFQKILKLRLSLKLIISVTCLLNFIVKDFFKDCKQRSSKDEKRYLKSTCFLTTLK